MRTQNKNAIAKLKIKKLISTHQVHIRLFMSDYV